MAISKKGELSSPIWFKLIGLASIIFLISSCSQSEIQPKRTVAVVSLKYSVTSTVKTDGITRPPLLTLTLSPTQFKSQFDRNATELETIAADKLGPYWVTPKIVVQSRTFQDLQQFINRNEDFIPDGYKATSLAYTNAAPDLCKDINVDSVAQVEIRVEPVLYRDSFQFPDTPDRLKVRITADWNEFNREGRKIYGQKRVVDSDAFIEISDQNHTISGQKIMPLVESGLTQLSRTLERLR